MAVHDVVGGLISPRHSSRRYNWWHRDSRAARPPHHRFSPCPTCRRSTRARYSICRSISTSWVSTHVKWGTLVRCSVLGIAPPVAERANIVASVVCISRDSNTFLTLHYFLESGIEPISVGKCFRNPIIGSVDLPTYEGLHRKNIMC